ncbi:chemotaxis response regulator protein-glutamate methylesterase [Erythrobacter sp. LQ02-29]|uniref:protein-glutamate methylesterase/protein-glutamine glutaminase n=1 Tax=Erythrobacter sp. LQ02-29 TaxID=2920384 RepID=UPI001F4E66A4|nr:chemotaxis response regulator protein-glutamate methylesterase [Erythrobacter sp. LQ02-29]MCP9222817.1 chemotaxis response regulator protein-glutamate methylesterase [Erythrobacter sp. LQ02-29]
MPTRVLIVDDSPTMLALLRRELDEAPDIDVVGVANSAYDARDKIKALNPDVITLDIEMEGMSGLEFLRRVMQLRPMPVVMVSSLTSEGANASLTALELGAFACHDKNNLGARKVEHAPSLVELVRSAALRARLTCSPSTARAERPARDYSPRPDSVIAIGVSTGGVETLIELLGGFPADCPPTVIVQHMPPSFTTSFAARLDRKCPPKVAEARAGAKLVRGQVYIAPGGDRHLEIAGERGQLYCRLTAGERVNGHRPSADRLFQSVARVAGDTALGMILTGMGCDGAAGLKGMRDRGAMTLGQDEATSIVYGMPAAALNCGAVTEQLPLRRIGQRALEWCRA